MKRKFSYLVIIMLIGIISTYHLSSNYLYKIFIGICILIIFFEIFLKRKLKISIVVLMYLLGVFLIYINLNGNTLSNFVNKEILLEGLVLEKQENDTNINSYILRSEKIFYKDKEIKMNEKTKIKIIGETKIQIGDSIRVRTKLKEPRTNTNPKLYNYRQNLQSKKIYTISTINSYNIIEYKQNEEFIFKIKNKFRENVIELFKDNLNLENRSLMTSIVLGDYKYLSEDHITSYRALGIAHLLAVSGLHIGIISSFFIKVLSEIGIERKYTHIGAIFIIWFYSFLIGFPISTLRACIMLTLALIAKSSVEPYDPINNLFVSMFILLIINPFSIFNLSFQLSYMASFSLIFLTNYVKDIFQILDFKKIDIVQPIIAVQIGLIPIQMYYFNQISIITLFTNLLIVPLVSSGLVIAFIMILFSYIFPYVNRILGFILDIILSGERTLTELFSSIPFTSIKFRSPEIWEIVLYYFLLMIIIGKINIGNFSKNIQKIVILWSIIFILIINIIPLMDNSLYLEFIDVGQGDSILIQYKGRRYLVDTGGEVLGSFKIGENITLPYLIKQGYSSINGLFITHFHDDHCKAAPLLVRELKIGKLLASYKNEDNQIYKELKELNKNPYILKRDDKIKVGKNLTIRVISPTKDMIDRNYSENNKSLVLLLEYFDYKILLAGDMEGEVEEYLSMDNNLKNIDIIKVPHHGSTTSSGEEFLKHTNPKNAIITVGLNNLFGHPNEEVLERYRNNNTNIYRTDIDGNISVKIDKNGIDIKSFLGENKKKEINLSIYLISFINAYCIMQIYLRDKESYLIEL